MEGLQMHNHKIVTSGDWRTARIALLEKEKEFTRARDALSRQRRELPWVKLEKSYYFDTTSGQKSLGDLFAGRSQLIIQHFMFGPEWEEGCPSCSFWADGYNGFAVHLAHRDVSMVTVSRAPLQKLLDYRKRMGWTFDWVSSLGSDFNSDFHVSFAPEDRAGAEYNYRDKGFPSEEAPGISVFVQSKTGEIFHTYSCYARGLDMMNAAYHYLDLVPKGRDEDELPYGMAWLKRKDQYED